MRHRATDAWAVAGRCLAWRAERRMQGLVGWLRWAPAGPALQVQPAAVLLTCPWLAPAAHSRQPLNHPPLSRYAPTAKDLASRDVVSRSMTMEIREVCAVSFVGRLGVECWCGTAVREHVWYAAGRQLGIPLMSSRLFQTSSHSHSNPWLPSPLPSCRAAVWAPRRITSTCT